MGGRLIIRLARISSRESQRESPGHLSRNTQRCEEKQCSEGIRLENAPTCYRAPKWPDPEFPRKIPKKYPAARNSGLPEFTPKMPRKYRKNTPKIPKMRIFGIFSFIFGVFSWGSRISARGVFFRYFSWKFRVGPSRGSVAGRGVLKIRLPTNSQGSRRSFLATEKDSGS